MVTQQATIEIGDAWAASNSGDAMAPRGSAISSFFASPIEKKVSPMIQFIDRTQAIAGSASCVMTGLW